MEQHIPTVILVAGPPHVLWKNDAELVTLLSLLKQF